MNALCTAATPLEAEILRAYFAEHGIDVDVLGSELWAARGELAVDAYPRLMLRDPRDESRARALLLRYSAPSRQTDWTCSCGEPVPASFECCWACGRERPA